MKTYTPLLLSVALLAVACGDGKKNKDAENELTRAEYVAERNLVDTMILRKQTFHQEVVANGRLRALRKSELHFLSSGELMEVSATNGQSVSKGAVLARLDPYQAKQRLEQSRQSLERSYLDLREALIGFGYDYSTDTTDIPRERLQTAYTRSGYLTAQSNYELAQQEVLNLELKAPFSGKVANLTKKIYEQAGPGEAFCLLIDDSAFEVDFNLLESEIAFIRLGQTIEVTPFNSPDQHFSGRVTQINPLVDSRGQINVRAEIANRDSHLLEGMNVKVVIRQALPDQLVVPKGAVVNRDNQEVLFRFSDDGKAMWTYVNVLLSNSTYHVVRADEVKGAELNLGDAIITTGNLNLGNGSTVEIRP
ncbi:MAG: efflux RND transporter periplasmic adaptor subunit [Rikenellaceae bacterium]|jgi:RND family efflux transporter MFP subunit|nr:efflux RND transporter periplasmic adaptor subunit [Rikenellaceae bacterium]